MINLEKILLPKYLQNKFELVELEDKENEWITHFVEKEDRILNAAKPRIFGENNTFLQNSVAPILLFKYDATDFFWKLC